VINDIELQLVAGRKVIGSVWEIRAKRSVTFTSNQPFPSLERVRTSTAVRSELHRLLDKALDTIEKGAY